MRLFLLSSNSPQSAQTKLGHGTSSIMMKAGDGVIVTPSTDYINYCYTNYLTVSTNTAVGFLFFFCMIFCGEALSIT